MKKTMLIISVCALFSGCRPDPVKYSDLIVGLWEAKEPVIEISGVTGDKYAMIRQEMREKFDRTGDIFEFTADKKVIDPDGIDIGTYTISNDILRIVAAETGVSPVNFRITSLSYRTIILTYDALAEEPAYAVHFPELTKCLVTIAATKRNKKQQPENETSI